MQRFFGPCHHPTLLPHNNDFYCKQRKEEKMPKLSLTLSIIYVLILLALKRQAVLLKILTRELASNEPLDDAPVIPLHRSRNESILHYDVRETIQSVIEHKFIEEKVHVMPAVRRWAYVFVVGGCGSNHPSYRGFIYNIAVAAKILQDSGTKADLVAMIQMSVKTNETVLPKEEQRILEVMGVKVKYIPKYSSPVHENFYSLMLEKFRILQLTDYSRIIFLDADVMPFCSLDYLFELSEPETGEPTFKENVLLSFSSQPAHGGLFMLTPHKNDYKEIQEIIHSTETRALALPPPDYWDEVLGWGHKIIPPDRWRSQRQKYSGTNWTWHGVFADQGLLYYWTKYYKQSVTLIIDKEIENWSSRNGTATLESTPLRESIYKASCNGRFLFPYTDIKHFTGRAKPWQRNHTHYRTPQQKGSANANQAERLAPVFEDFNSTKIGSLSAEAYTYVTWFRAFDEIEKKVGFKLYLEPYLGKNLMKGPPVGKFPDSKKRILHIHAKATNDWNAYQSDV